MFNSPHSGLTLHPHSLYFSLLIGCLSTLTGSSKLNLNRKHWDTAVTQPVGKPNTGSPPPSKRPRLTEGCPYGLSSFDLVLQLDNGTRVPANREETADGAGSEYFRALLKGGFGEAQGGAGEAIHIRDVSTGMLLPVLHYLHGCRFSVDREETEGQCRILDSLALEGLSDNSADSCFQKTPLGEALAGACRFLVTGLQRELEDLCVSLLLSCCCSTNAKEDKAEKDSVAKTKTDQGCLESAEEENLASRTSELELSGIEIQMSGSPQKTHGKKTSLRGSRGFNEQKTEKGVAKPAVDKTPDPEELRLKPKSLVKGSALALLLPQVYWFSQRFSYPVLGRACLSLLLGFQDCPPPFSSSSSSSSLAADCLRRLSREADCVEALKRDLLSLATAALS